ncbi:2Fe-2S iron-sulfur cluster-binding protein [Candidatus Zixiibacteriota bacterium]
MIEPESKAVETTGAATREFRIRFEPAGVTVEVNPADLPYDNDGEPGSLLDIALENDIEIDHACGGFCSCSTCHVIIRRGMESCSEASDEELDMLDNAPGATPDSRLACQCIPDGTTDLTVEIPAWNRNRAKEDH